MKLTPDLLSNSISRINPLKDRELVLRDNKISAIENLGVTKDLNDAIDFTNNDIRQLGNFPRMLRLRVLLLANNRIGRIDSQLVDYIPNLTTLILSNNLIQELGDLEPLTKCAKLEYLSLLDNPVTKKKYYRLYIIHKIPSVRVLDFKRIRKAERDEAKELFKSEEGKDNELAISIGEAKTKTFDVGDGLENDDHRKSNAPGLSAEEQAKIKEALKNATSLDEMQRLENLLKSGHLPGDKRKGQAVDEMEEDEE
ncbi:U2 snRNP complex subunit [Umbelopsis sp. WA50703]